MDLEEGVWSPTVNSKLIPYQQDPGLESTSYGTNEGENTSPTHRFRIRTVVYSCVVAIQAWFVNGYSIGYTSPILSDLDSANSTYASLHKSVYQDIFSVGSKCCYKLIYDRVRCRCYCQLEHYWALLLLAG